MSSSDNVVRHNNDGHPGKPPLFSIDDPVDGNTLFYDAKIYHGQRPGLDWQLNAPVTDHAGITLNILEKRSLAFIGSNLSMAAIADRVGGNNVMQSNAASSFFDMGTIAGKDSAYMDAGYAQGADTWTTVANLGSGDSATIWHMGAKDAAPMHYVGVEGADGYTGATFEGQRTDGGATTRITFAGVDVSDIKTSFGEAGGVAYFAATHA